MDLASPFPLLLSSLLLPFPLVFLTFLSSALPIQTCLEGVLSDPDGLPKALMADQIPCHSCSACCLHKPLDNPCQLKCKRVQMDRPCGLNPPASDQIPFYDCDGTLGSCIDCAAPCKAPVTVWHDSRSLQFGMHRYVVWYPQIWYAQMCCGAGDFAQICAPCWCPMFVANRSALVWWVTTIARI